jgi:hypothetical protein
MSGETLTSDQGLLNVLVAGIDYACQLHGFGMHTCADCQHTAESLWYLVRTRKRGHYKILCCKCMVKLKRKWITDRAIGKAKAPVQ